MKFDWKAVKIAECGSSPFTLGSMQEDDDDFSLITLLMNCRTISPEQGKTLADSWKAVFVESSAKENKVKDCFVLQ